MVMTVNTDLSLLPHIYRWEFTFLTHTNTLINQSTGQSINESTNQYINKSICS